MTAGTTATKYRLILEKIMPFGGGQSNKNNQNTHQGQYKSQYNKYANRNTIKTRKIYKI